MSRIWSGLLVAGPCTDIKSLFHSSLTHAERQVTRKEDIINEMAKEVQVAVAAVGG